MGKDVVPEGVVNVLEMIVRCFDCWLSCAAHITVVNEDGEELYSRKLNVGLGWVSNKNSRLDTTASLGQNQQNSFFSFVF